ncbi:hypothetical protein ACVJGD_004461 [Bradyrhizobium sp. USDA 10063]
MPNPPLIRIAIGCTGCPRRVAERFWSDVARMYGAHSGSDQSCNRVVAMLSVSALNYPRGLNSDISLGLGRPCVDMLHAQKRDAYHLGWYVPPSSVPNV